MRNLQSARRSGAPVRGRVREEVTVQRKGPSVGPADRRKLAAAQESLGPRVRVGDAPGGYRVGGGNTKRWPGWRVAARAHSFSP